MIHKYCNNCLFKDTDQCEYSLNNLICQSFSPICEDVSDDTAYNEMERSRAEYRNAFFEYLEESNYFNA